MTTAANIGKQTRKKYYLAVNFSLIQIVENYFVKQYIFPQKASHSIHNILFN